MFPSNTIIIKSCTNLYRSIQYSLCCANLNFYNFCRSFIFISRTRIFAAHYDTGHHQRILIIISLSITTPCKEIVTWMIIRHLVGKLSDKVEEREIERAIRKVRLGNWLIDGRYTDYGSKLIRPIAYGDAFTNP